MKTKKLWYLELEVQGLLCCRETITAARAFGDGEGDG